MAVAVHASQLQFLDRNFPCSGCYCYRCVVRFLLAMLNVGIQNGNGWEGTTPVKK